MKHQRIWACRCSARFRPSRGEGKTRIAVDLARSLAHEGRRVLVIDADLRSPRAHEAFALPAGPGLADVLDQQLGVQQVTATVVQDVRLSPAVRSRGGVLHAL